MAPTHGEKNLHQRTKPPKRAHVTGTDTHNTKSAVPLAQGAEPAAERNTDMQQAAKQKRAARDENKGQKRRKVTQQPKSATPAGSDAVLTSSDPSPAKLVKAGQALGTGGIMHQRLVFHLVDRPGAPMLSLKDILLGTDLGKRFPSVKTVSWNATEDLWRIACKEAGERGMEQSSIAKLKAPACHPCSEHRHLLGLDHIRMLYFLCTPPEREVLERFCGGLWPAEELRTLCMEPAQQGAGEEERTLVEGNEEGQDEEEDAGEAGKGDGQEEELPMKGNVEIQEEELAPEEEDDEEAIKVGGEEHEDAALPADIPDADAKRRERTPTAPPNKRQAVEKPFGSPVAEETDTAAHSPAQSSPAQSSPTHSSDTASSDKGNQLVDPAVRGSLTALLEDGWTKLDQDRKKREKMRQLRQEKADVGRRLEILYREKADEDRKAVELKREFAALVREVEERKRGSEAGLERRRQNRARLAAELQSVIADDAHWQEAISSL